MTLPEPVTTPHEGLGPAAATIGADAAAPVPGGDGAGAKPTRRRPTGRAGWHARAGALVLAWVAAAGVVSLMHRQVPAANWLMVHLLLLGAVSNALLVWSWHFTQAVLRLPSAPDRRSEAIRLALFNVGALAVVGGVVADARAPVLVGTALAIGVLLAHVVVLVRALRRALPSRFAVTVRYYVAAGVLAVPALLLGAVLTRGGVPWADPAGVLLAHAVIGLLGWVGLPILGTLLTLWPTMLRTRMADAAERHARTALPWLVAATVLAAAALLAGRPQIAVLGVAGFLGAAAWNVAPMVAEMRQRPPASFATWSTLAGVVWLGVALAGLAVALARVALTGGLADADATAAIGGGLTAAAVVGGVLQVLLGSLSYLLPVMAGGGPAAVRGRNARADRAMVARLLITNVGLAVCLLPSPSAVTVTASVVVLGALVATVVCIAATLRPPGGKGAAPADAHPAAPPAASAGWVPRHGAGLVTGLGVLLLAVAAGVAVDPAALGTIAVGGTDAAAGATPTGRTTRVEVTISGMRYQPARISVPAGDALVITLTNTGDDVHDLTLETGQRTPRLKPGESATLDLGVVGRSLDGWCSVAGHRQMGMVLAVDVTGGSSGDLAGDDDSGAQAGMDHGTAHGGTDTADAVVPDLMADPGPGFRARDARLAPAPDERVHHMRLEVTETVAEVAPGVRQTRWTFGGTSPGPVLRGKVGDTFVVTLVNDGSIGHSIDFHAGALAPDQPMRTIAPGEELEYRFTATRAGIWMYHCSTMPMSMHIANGMFGAVVIDPPGLPAVDHEFLLVQSESYLGPQDGTADADKIAAGDADLVVFNGYPMQYDHAPLQVRVGDRIRIWVLAAGPNRGSSFHVVGGQFDTVFREGALDLTPGEGDGGSQALGLFPAQGGYVELALPEAGHYPFVTHAMSDAERGAHGILEAVEPGASEG